MLHDHHVLRRAPSLDPDLDRLVDDLQQLPLRCRLIVESVCGEPDVRIEVRSCPDGDLAVELLCCTPDNAALPRWHAVRVAGCDRQVWQGPPSDCHRSDVVRFVADLLTGGDDELGRRYRLLG